MSDHDIILVHLVTDYVLQEHVHNVSNHGEDSEQKYMYEQHLNSPCNIEALQAGTADHAAACTTYHL